MIQVDSAVSQKSVQKDLRLLFLWCVGSPGTALSLKLCGSHTNESNSQITHSGQMGPGAELHSCMWFYSSFGPAD